MTRDEAVKVLEGILNQSYDYHYRWVDAFAALGLLKFDTSADRIYVDAAKCIEGTSVIVTGGSGMYAWHQETRLTEASIARIFNALNSAGFKITR